MEEKVIVFKMTRKEDQRELINIPCVICGGESGGIIRTKEVCNKCYSILNRDNIHRYNKGIDIPDSFFIFKRCFGCNKLFEIEFKEIKPEYCEDCKEE